MGLKPASEGVCDWLNGMRVSRRDPEVTPSVLDTVFPWLFEELVIVPHDIDPSTDKRPEGQLSREQADLLGGALGRPDEVIVGVWVGSPTELRSDGRGFPRWEARPGVECFVGVAALADLIQAQPSYIRDFEGAGADAVKPHEASMGPVEDRYFHRFGGATMDPLSTPYLWWARQHDWLIVTDMDSPFTVVGCSSVLAEKIRSIAGTMDP